MRIRPPQRILPNGVKDEVNVTAGVKTQKTREIVLDGNLNWTGLREIEENTYRFNILPSIVLNNNYVSTTASPPNAIERNNDAPYKIAQDSATVDERSILIRSDVDRIYVRVEKVKINAMAGVDTLAKFKAYLNQFPIALTYQLAIPKIFMSKKIY